MRDSQGFTITNDPEVIVKFAEAFIDVLANRLSRKELCGIRSGENRKTDYNDKLSQNDIDKKTKEETELSFNIESSEEPILLNAKDISQIMKIGLNKTYELFKSQDFPALQIGKQYFIERSVLIDWLKQGCLCRKEIEI